MPRVGELCVRSRPLDPSGTIGRAAEAFRCAGVASLPVVVDGRVIGELRASELASFLTSGPPERLARVALTQAPLDAALVVPEYLDISQAFSLLQREGRECATVVDQFGQYVGYVTLGHLMSGVCGRVRPPMVGGMATPFGVYLTAGVVRGGVGDRELASTGAYLATMTLFASIVAWLVFPGDGSLLRIAALAPFVDWLAAGLEHFQLLPHDAATIFVFALMFRFSGVSGYHAAEHQVVHTIEAAEDLVPANVRRKPRVHPRCGTNIVAAVSILAFFWSQKSELGAALLVPALLLTALTWRRVGGWLQQHVTTRRPSEAHIESGIRAGEELMANHQSNLWERPSIGRRLWNMGLAQVLCGYTLVFAVWYLICELLPAIPPEIRLL